MNSIKVDGYVIETLLPSLVGHDKRPSAFVIYIYLWYRSDAATRSVFLSLQMLSEDTGLSKTAIQIALRLLLRKRLIRVQRSSRTSVPEYLVLKPWRQQ